MPRLPAFVGVLVISFSAVFVRLAGVSPETAALFRAAYAVPVLWLLTRLWRPDPPRGALARKLALGAGVLLAFDLSFWHRAIGLVGAGLATVLGNTQVVFVALAAWLLHGERPRPRALMLLPVIFLGAVLISGLGRPGAYGEDPVAGTVFGVLTGLTYSVFLLLFRASNRGITSPAGPLLDVSLGAAVTALGVGWLEGGLSLVPSWPAHGWLVSLALGSQVVGWLLIAVSLPRLPALDTSVLLLLQPVLTVFWGRLLFAERLSVLQGVGVALVIAGVGWLSLAGSVEPAAGKTGGGRAGETEKLPS